MTVPASPSVTDVPVPDVPMPDVVVYAADRPDTFLPTVVDLRRQLAGARVVVAVAPGADVSSYAGSDVELVTVNTPAEVLNRIRPAWALLVIGGPVLVPPAALDNARELLDGDARVATVSFWSNAAGPLSFPHWQTPASHHLGNALDETEVTRRLRAASPDLGVVPIPRAAGSAVLIGADALAIVGEFVPHDRVEITLADFSLRCQGHGLRNALDPTTFFSRPIDLADAATSDLNEAEQAWLRSTHPVAAAAALTAPAGDAPLSMAFGVSRAKVTGLRLAIDASTLGPTETGTQVQTLALIDALAQRPDVASVGVALGGPIPPYAERVLHQRKVRASWCTSDDFTPLGAVDVVHRPFQPDRPLDIAGWRQTAHRTVLTIQDLIYYEVGAYHDSPDNWERVRASVRQAVRDVDAVVAIARDVAVQIRDERLSIDPDRVFVVENGTDHLSGDETAHLPPVLSRNGVAAAPFVLVLGTNYGHKNRHLAMAAVDLLRAEGVGVELVMAGPTVPRGSTRIAESRVALRSSTAAHVLPDVTSQERNWLLRHAALVLYPTSAEGFGLVPYEAARFGTPTVHVSFGPLAEVAPDLPVSAAGWSPRHLADACRSLLLDPDLRAAQLAAVLRAADTYTWERTADLLVRTYRTALAEPQR
ncbi:glycosyltransferase [Modestobacter versicolor]|uniref:glycosyltransferase n=1 Tax=Modestobacter versicolor TaxID=429133 RepID=UPI0034DFBBFA